MLHLTVYAARDARTVIHAHPVSAAVISRAHAAAGEVRTSGWEMLKALAGVETHEHEATAGSQPIVQNLQIHVRLAEGATLQHLRSVAAQPADRIAHQPQPIHDLIGPHAELVLHAGFVQKDFAELAVHAQDGDVGVAHQLAEVFVVGDDDGLQTRLGGLARQRAHDVVGFVTGQLEHRHAQRLAHAIHIRQLRDQVGRHIGPVRLVVAELLVPEGRLRRVERDAQVIGFVDGHQPPQHHREPINRIGRHPLRVRQATNGVKRAEDVRHAVNEKEAFFVWHGWDYS